MKCNWLIVPLLLMVATIAISDEVSVKVDKDSDAKVAVVEEPRSFTLEDAVYEQEDHADRGNVILLNDGVVVLEHTEVGDIAGDGEVTVPTEVAVLQIRKPVETEGARHAVLSYEDVDFDIFWREDGSGGILTIWDGDILVQLNVNPTLNDNGGGPSCEVTCGGGSCNTSCPEGKACIAYCNSNTPVCSCTKPPKKKKQVRDTFDVGEAALIER